MSYKLLFIAVFVSAIIVIRKRQIVLRENRFDDYLQKFNKSYDVGEYFKRMLIFEESLKEIEILNKEYGSGVIHVLTQFSDWTQEEKDRKNRFEEYLRKFKKSYNSKEFITRMLMFEESLKEIEKLNSKEHGTGAKYGPTNFSDWTLEEKRKVFGKPAEMLTVSECRSVNKTCGYKRHKLLKTVKKEPVNGVLDWRDEGVIGPVMNQKQCNGCWAFSIVGIMESMAALNYSSFQQLSVQELLDCSNATAGCQGGNIDTALTFLCGDYKVTKDTFNITTEDNYPLALITQKCRKYPAGGTALLGYITHCDLNDKQLMDLLKHGPVMTVINPAPLYYYIEGVVERHCPPKGFTLYHVVQIVGYSLGGSGVPPHYILRNSYGEDWGESGYVRIAMGPDNLCGIRSHLASLDAIRY